MRPLQSFSLIESAADPLTLVQVIPVGGPAEAGLAASAVTPASGTRVVAAVTAPRTFRFLSTFTISFCWLWMQGRINV